MSGAGTWMKPMVQANMSLRPSKSPRLISTNSELPRNAPKSPFIPKVIYRAVSIHYALSVLVVRSGKEKTRMKGVARSSTTGKRMSQTRMATTVFRITSIIRSIIFIYFNITVSCTTFAIAAGPRAGSPCFNPIHFVPIGYDPRRYKSLCHMKRR